MMIGSVIQVGEPFKASVIHMLACCAAQLDIKIISAAPWLYLRRQVLWLHSKT